MMTHLETFRQEQFPIGVIVKDDIIYRRKEILFKIEGVLDVSVIKLLEQIRKKKTDSKQLFEDCSIYFYNNNSEIGVCRDTNVKEFEKRVRSLFRTNLAPPSVLTQLLSTLPSPIVNSSTTDNIITIDDIIQRIKTACNDKDEQHLDEKTIEMINQLRKLAITYNYKVPPVLLDSGRLFYLCVGFDGDSLVLPFRYDFVNHVVSGATNFHLPNRMTVNKCKGISY